METKRIELKSLDDDGSGLAKIATLSAVDHDGDTYEKGAFGEQEVKVLAGHSWDGVPIGKGRVFEKDGDAFAEFRLNLDTEAGKQWHAALKFDLDSKNGKPLQEWSYGFKVLESVDETRDGKSIRVLKRLEVFEVSPVVKGSGVGTGTVAIKSGQTFEQEIKALIDQTDSIVKRAGEIAIWRRSKGRKFSEERLEQLMDLEGKMRILIDHIKAPDSKAGQQDADRLMAAYTAIQCGQKGSKSNG